MERSTVMFKFLVYLLLVSTGLAAPAPATDTTTDSSNTLGKSLPGIIANVKTTEVLQPNKASEGLAKSTPGVILESSSADKTQIHTSDNKTEECTNETLSATDKSDKIIDQKEPEDKTNININSETSIKSDINVKDSHKEVTGQTPLSHYDSSVNEELDSSRRKAKVLDSGRLETESESASVQLQPGHDAPTASQGRVESLSSHVQQNSANQHLESHKSPLDKNSAVNKEDDKIQSLVSANNILTKEKQEKKEDNKADITSKHEGRAIINTSDKNILIENKNVPSASEKHSDPSIIVKNVEVGVTPGPINKIGSLQSELDRGLIALNVFQKLSELLDLNAISTNNSVVADRKLISKDKNIVSPQPTAPLKNIDDSKLDNASNSRGSLKFEKNDSSFSDDSEIEISKNSEIDKITKSATQAKVTTSSTKVISKVTTPSAKLQTVDAKVTTPSTLPKIVDTKDTTPSSFVKIVESKVTTTSAEIKSKVTTPSIENITEKIKLIKELDSSKTSVSNSGTTKTYQDSSNFRHPSNVDQNKKFENQSINIQAKPLEDNVSNTHLDESTINPVTRQQGHSQVTQTPAPTVQWIKITPPANQTPAAKINNDENLEVQEANYLSTAAKNQFQSNNNYPYNSNTRVPKVNAGVEKSLEESKFVKIIPTANQGIISAIPNFSQTFESSSEPQSYSSPKYIAYDNTQKSINDKESFSTPGPFSYSTVNNIDNNYYSRNPTSSPLDNNRQPTVVLNQTKDSIADAQINTNVNTGRYENQRSRNTPTVGKIFSSSDNGNIAQSRDAYKSLQEISLDTPKEHQPYKDKIDVVVQTVPDSYKNAIRRVNPNAARNNNSFENVSPSNVPYVRGENKYKSNRFDTISAFTTDSQINKLYTQSSPTTKSQYNPVTQRSRNRVTSSTTISSSLKEEKNILDKRNEEKLIAVQKVSNTKETPKGKYAVRTSRGNIKYVKNPHSGDWLGDGDDKYPPQFSYNYKTATGISAYQKGVLTEINDRKVFVIHGSYNYTAPDGTPVIMTYTADEFGFHPQQTVSVVKNKLEPTKSKDFDKELGKRRAKMVRKAQHSERMNSTETENNNSEEESPVKVDGPVEPVEIAEETTKLAKTVDKIARGRGRNIYREVNNNGDANNVREVITVEAEKEIKTPQRILRRRNPNPTVPLESA